MSLRPLVIHRIGEPDIDALIKGCGGEKIEPDQEQQGLASADYFLDGTLIELKIIQEEGMDKPDRQLALAELFLEQFPDRPVIVLDPGLLEAEQQRRYYRILEGPIKTHAKKASKQLKAGQQRLKERVERKVLLIINNGFMSLRHDDFERVVLKCVRNDTSGIDHVIIAGLYYDSDGWDSLLSTHFGSHVINASIDFDHGQITQVWDKFVLEYATDMVKKPCVEEDPRGAIEDISFEVEGRLFVRPRARFHAPSDFHPSGARPRTNSTNIISCPPIATVLPDLDQEQWSYLQKRLIDRARIKGDYGEWSSWVDGEIKKAGEPLRPLMLYRINLENWFEKLQAQSFSPTFHSLCSEAAQNHTRRSRELASAAIELPAHVKLGTSFILVETMEIGGDKTFDLSTVRFISEIRGFEREETLVKNERIFHEYAICVGAAYAVKHDCNQVFFTKNTDYKWA